jgi:bifunctional non-homologous end joining protein LigD
MLPAKPCLPTSTPSPPSGPEWLHEIKHDGYRMLAHHDGACVRLISRRGLDWGWRFPTIVAAVKALAVRSCILDGELIACDTNGLADFQLLRWRKRDDPAIYCAFDLLQLDGRDLRDEPIETRKAELAWMPTARARPEIVPPRLARNGLCRGPQRGVRVSLGRGRVRSISYAAG